MPEPKLCRFNNKNITQTAQTCNDALVIGTQQNTDRLSKIYESYDRRIYIDKTDVAVG
jgi:hypothetical protein